MNFEPPDYTNDVKSPNRTTNMQQFRTNHYQSPLLQKPYEKNASLPKFNMPNHNNSNVSGVLQNRLGTRNSYRPNSVNSQPNLNDNQYDARTFNNRKRPGDNTNKMGPMPQRKKWHPNNRPYYNKNQNGSQGVSSAQNRLNRIRSNQPQTAGDEMPQYDNRQEVIPEPELNESQEFDATDITVEVINHNAQPREESNLVRFKMALDAKTQAAIRVIQQKRKEKQVISPIPVTPNVTGISIHERFSML